ncbi:MAG: 30S ribosomal protein S19e [Nanoarchaeota archaeon]
MPTINDVPTNELIEVVAKDLVSSGAVKAPAWATFAKTGCHKERAPTRKDWWEVRAAALLRKVSLMGPIGVSKLRTIYGGKKNMGSAPEQNRKGSGAIIRHILQQLDKAGLTRHTKVGVHCGRVVTPKGKSVLDKAATRLAKDLKITIKPAPANDAESEVIKAAEEISAPAAPETAGEKKPSKKKHEEKAPEATP